MFNRMVKGMGRVGVVALLLLALSALWATAAAAEPGSGPRETIDQTFTTTKPSSPSGGTFSAAYHAADDPNGNPPFLKRMVFHPPAGMVYDTSVPDRCTAPDTALQVFGASACPAGSRLGIGYAEGLFFVPFAHDFVFDHFSHSVDVFNNANEQILLVNSEGSTVVRGHFQPDGSIDFVLPTCFPTPPAGDCVDDYVLTLKTFTAIPAYTVSSPEGVRSYQTTPPTCPKGRYWSTTVDFFWGDGSTDSVVTKQPCSR
jgi:hypothetical protein